MRKEIKKAVSCILVAGMGIVPGVSCVSASVPVSVYVGQKKQLNWNYGKVRKWWSVDNSTVKVSSKGMITGLKEGNTVVKAKAYKGKHWRIRWFNVKVTKSKTYEKLQRTLEKLRKQNAEMNETRTMMKAQNDEIWEAYDFLEAKAGEMWELEDKMYMKALDCEDGTAAGKKKAKKYYVAAKKADKQMDEYIKYADKLKDVYCNLAEKFKTEE